VNSWQYRYDTGWINRSDWTNVHLGSDTTLNTDSNVTHNLNAPLPNLLVKLFVSTDGTDANSFEVASAGNDSAAGSDWGVTFYAVDNNNIIVQTGLDGIIFVNSAGSNTGLDTENYYYKVKVYFLG
jgi:hypothetical protein